MGGCNVQCTCYTEHGRYGLSCLYAEAVHGVHEQCMLGLYGMYGVWCMVYGLFKLCCEILLLLNIVDMDQWKTVE